MDMKLLIVNGPNLNLLGIREPEIYGHDTWQDIFLSMKSRFSGRVELHDCQSNHEGEIIDVLQRAHSEGFSGVVLNAAAFSHYSIAIADTIAAITIPVVEVHMSNVYARETFRHTSVIAPVCVGSIVGFGVDSYRLAIEALLNKV